MAIKVGFLAGETEKRASSLYQWDYGQTLEIEAPYLPTIVEVHFACRDMKDAIVCVCSATLGVATVTIPDLCLEHTGEITAWVYGIEGTSGRTMYRITIPIVSRARPSRSDAIPEDVQDNYTQLISEVNEAVEKITDGAVVAARATHAETATNATNASNAASASHAESAANATNATNANLAAEANKAQCDGDGNVISSTYQKKLNGTWTYAGTSTNPTIQLKKDCMYLFRVSSPVYSFASVALFYLDSSTNGSLVDLGLVSELDGNSYFRLIMSLTTNSISVKKHKVVDGVLDVSSFGQLQIWYREI